MRQPSIPDEIVVPAEGPLPEPPAELINPPDTSNDLPGEVLSCKNPELFPPGTVFRLSRRPSVSARGWDVWPEALHPVSETTAKQMVRSLDRLFAERLELRNLDQLTVCVTAHAPGLKRIRVVELEGVPHDDATRAAENDGQDEPE